MSENTSFGPRDLGKNDFAGYMPMVNVRKK